MEGIRRVFCVRGAETSSYVIYTEFLDQKINYQIEKLFVYWQQDYNEAHRALKQIPKQILQPPPQKQMDIS